jgi:hypothetical protein
VSPEIVHTHRFSREEYEQRHPDAPLHSGYGLAVDYAYYVFALLEDGPVYPSAVTVLGGHPSLGEVTVLVDVGDPVRDMTAAILVGQNWPEELFPIGAVVHIEPERAASSEVAGLLIKAFAAA